MEASKADIVILDDIQTIEDEGNHYIKEKLEDVLKRIKLAGIKLSIPIIGAYSISRKISDNRPDHRPMIQDLEYNALVSYPDNIQFLYSDEMYNRESEEKSIEEVITVKSMLGDFFTTKTVCVNRIFANMEKAE